MNDQLILKFPSNNAFKKEDFYVSHSNVEAYNLIDSWPKWLKRTINIFGPSASGKSHLVSIFKSKTSYLQVRPENLNEETFFKFKTKESLIIENFDGNITEELLFLILNTALQDNKYLLITSKKPINTYQFKLRDLASRINSCLIIGIKLPSDDLISVILSKSFSDRQIKVKKNHIDYIVKRIDRSYEKISHFILTLDKYSLKKGSPFGLKLIKEVLKMV